MRFRGKSIRRKIVALLLVPLVSLTAIWAFATVVTGREAIQLLDASDVVGELGYPVEDAVHALQKERRETLVRLADPRGSGGLNDLTAQQRDTDKVMSKLRSNADKGGIRGKLSSESQTQLTAILEGADGLGSLRRKVENNKISREGAFQAFNKLVDTCYSFRGSLAAVPDADLDKQGRAVVSLTRGREALAREDALFVSAIAAGKMSKGDMRTLSDLIAERNMIYDGQIPLLPVSDQKIFLDYRRDTAAPEALQIAEDSLIAAGASKATQMMNRKRWESVTKPVLDDYDRLNGEADDRFQDRVRPEAMSVLVQAGIAGILGFLALIASLIVSIRIGRNLIRDLQQLRKDAHEASGVRLPSVMRRLAAGETVDTESEAPKLTYGPDEMGQVGVALNTLQRAAVEAAVKQADMRRGVSEVFVNLARRHQVLLHRQLTLLDTMERRTEDAEELADLFRLDHMTTRMRRHAEGLVILSGAAPSRQWRKPIQLMDVVRAAVSEVEDYERVEVRRLPRLAVNGPAVADLTHLIAELLENATVFSPPHTSVHVRGEQVSNGFTLEIHDRGLGMTPDALLEANLRLAETPDFELSDTDRLGLFVVSRLAQRQSVRVSLQPSPYGGTTAVVLIPNSLLTDDSPDEPTAAEETAGGETSETRLKAIPRPAEAEDVPAPVAVPGPPADEAPAEASRPRRGRHARPSSPDEERENIPRPSVSGRRGERDRHERLGNGLPVDNGAAEDEEGGLFRARGITPVPSTEQHQQAPSPATESRPDGALPLPRRRTPKLVSDHGRPVRSAPRSEIPARGQAPGVPSSDAARPSRDTDRADGARRGSDGGTDVEPDGTSTERSGRRAAGRPRPTVTSGAALPRRVRQASIAPQLREDTAPAGEPRPRSQETDPVREAEMARAKMSSLQRGWQRGRQQHTTSGDDPANTARGTTSEGDGR